MERKSRFTPVSGVTGLVLKRRSWLFPAHQAFCNIVAQGLYTGWNLNETTAVSGLWLRRKSALTSHSTHVLLFKPIVHMCEDPFWPDKMALFSGGDCFLVEGRLCVMIRRYVVLWRIRGGVYRPVLISYSSKQQIKADAWASAERYILSLLSCGMRGSYKSARLLFWKMWNSLFENCWAGKKSRGFRWIFEKKSPNA